MKRIVISNGNDSVRLLPDLEYEISPKEVGESAVMASGRTVYDFVGVKNVLTIPTGFLSKSDLSVLRRMIRANHILTITYDTPEGERSDLFLVKQPKLKTFKYDAAGVNVWYGITLTAEQYEVS